MIEIHYTTVMILMTYVALPISLIARWIIKWQEKEIDRLNKEIKQLKEQNK